MTAAALDTLDHITGEEEAGLEDEVGLEEDPVIHELDVYITKSLGKLVLAQYPLRPTYKPYKTAVREGFRVRPVQHEVEVDMKLQTNPSKPPQVQKLRVSQRPLLKPHSAIGLLKGRELHLTPLDSVLQLIPSFDHIDKRVAEDAKLNEKESDSAPQTQSLTRKFTKVESDRDKALRLSSFESVQQERCKESWVPCDYRPPEHPYTAGQKRAMLNKRDKKGVTGSEVKKSVYLDMLLPRNTSNQYSDSTLVGLRDLPNLAPSAQVEALMKNANVLSFNEICDTLPLLPASQILGDLQNCAHLVQGNWVVASKLVYPKGSKSKQTGVPADLMLRHRDFILYCFVNNCVVMGRHLQTICKIPPVEVEEILKQISVFTAHEGWTFKRPTCPEFAIQHPTVDQSQKTSWNDTYNELYSSLHLKSHRSNPLVEKQRGATEKIPGAVSTDLTSISKETASEIVEKLQLSGVVDPGTLLELGTIFRELIGQGAVLVRVVERYMSQHLPEQYCKALLNEMCAALRICYISVLTQEGEKEEALGYEKIGTISDKYRRVIFSLFESRYQISKSELRDAIHQQLQTSVTNKEYNSITSVLCDSPTSYKSGHWILKVNRTGVQ